MSQEILSRSCIIYGRNIFSFYSPLSVTTSSKIQFNIFTRSYTVPKATYTLKLVKESIDCIPRKHPGIMKIPCVYLPTDLHEAANKIIGEYDKNTINDDANTLDNYLKNRLSLPENVEYEEKKKITLAKLIDKGDISSVKDDLDIERLSGKEYKEFNKLLKKSIYNWKPIHYTSYVSCLYLISRLAPDFACLVNIFEEIKKRDKEFHPKSFFDFGSGVGSGLWALNTVWPNMCEEGYFVDSSSDMNNIAERLLKGGNIDNEYILSPKRSLFFRQFLPVSNLLQYDIVLSSRSLYELGTLKDRAKTADILWRKVAPGGFLIFVENSNISSYKMLMELRDFLLKINEERMKRVPKTEPIHVFAPCPHDMFCPRYFHESRRSCHFQVRYKDPRFTEAIDELYSYIVLRKSERSSQFHWPRIVQPVLVRHKHAVMRTCTPQGELQSFSVTKQKHTTKCYHICKKSNWGDFLPVTLLPLDKENANEAVTVYDIEDENSVTNHNICHEDESISIEDEDQVTTRNTFSEDETSSNFKPSDSTESCVNNYEIKSDNVIK